MQSEKSFVYHLLITLTTGHVNILPMLVSIIALHVRGSNAVLEAVKRRLEAVYYCFVLSLASNFLARSRLVRH